MKKIFLLITALYTFGIQAQENDSIPRNDIDYELGKGLTFDFDNQNYRFRIGGFVQALYAYDKVAAQAPDSRLYVNRAYLSLAGKAVQEKVGFLVQTDFRLSNPLLDAWVSYQPIPNVQISAGQKRSPLNNKEMMLNEDNFQFANRSLLSNTFTQTGREFGLFLDANYQVGNFGIVPQLALTSGDGRNSFGADSRDADKGGMKYGLRLDLYPLGYFSEGNDLFYADLQHEQSLKFVIGGAASINKGASHSTGEGHGSFQLYNGEQRERFPDYRKIYVDFISKYRGFSVLGEYVNTSATNLDGLFVDEAATTLLMPTQISTYLILGNAFNVQTGYVTKNGYAMDLRYTDINPEFKEVENGLLQKTQAYTIGLTKYFKGNDLKIQTAFSQIHQENKKSYSGELIIQLVF